MQPLLGPDPAIHVLEVLEAARASAREGRAVEVPTRSGQALHQNATVREMAGE